MKLLQKPPENMSATVDAHTLLKKKKKSKLKKLKTVGVVQERRRRRRKREKEEGKGSYSWFTCLLRTLLSSSSGT